MEKIIIVAVAKNNVIGNNGKIPWYSKEDLKQFKEVTMGFPIIMGRKTFESLKKPLPGRINIIISRNPNLKFDHENVKVFSNLDEAFRFCEHELKSDKLFIIGGGEIYNQTIIKADKIRITKMNFTAEGNVYFPVLDDKIWERISKESFEEFDVEVYTKKSIVKTS